MLSNWSLFQTQVASVWLPRLWQFQSCARHAKSQSSAPLRVTVVVAKVAKPTSSVHHNVNAIARTINETMQTFNTETHVAGTLLWELSSWSSERYPATITRILLSIGSALHSGTYSFIAGLDSLIQLQAELKDLTERIFVLYDLQPVTRPVGWFWPGRFVFCWSGPQVVVRTFSLLIYLYPYYRWHTKYYQVLQIYSKLFEEL